MAELSALQQTISGSRLVFYQQNDDTIRVRVYKTPESFDCEIILAAATWTALKAALSSAGDTYTPDEELGEAGMEHTVVI